MNGPTTKALIEFPSEFALKAIGHDAGQAGSFERLVTALVHAHVPEADRQAVSLRPSRAGNYQAVTVRFVARSQEQLETIYGRLSEQQQVVMLL